MSSLFTHPKGGGDGLSKNIVPTEELQRKPESIQTCISRVLYHNKIIKNMHERGFLKNLSSL